MYRTIDSGIWNDAWVSELPPEGKLLFLYLWTNPRITACGAYEITARQMAFETGLSPEAITTTLALLAPKIQYWPELRVVAVRNFYRWQRANASPTFTTAALKALQALPATVQAWLATAHDDLTLGPVSAESTLPVPYPQGTTSVPVAPHDPTVPVGNTTVTVTGTGESDAPARTRGTKLQPGVNAPAPSVNKPLPQPYALTEEMRVWVAMELPAVTPDLDRQHKLFCAHYWARGSEKRSAWRAEWEAWMLRSLHEFAPRGSPGNGKEPVRAGPGLPVMDDEYWASWEAERK